VIITRSPLRISLGGGGTDLPSFYNQEDGFVLSAAINKYVYVSVSKPFFNDISLKYSETEKVKTVEDVKHPIIREALILTSYDNQGIEISTHADVPAGTGLGSSGSFTTALLKSLYQHSRNSISPSELANLACHLEIEKLGEPIGKQDQYIATLGGFQSMEFHQDGRVTTSNLNITRDKISEFQENLIFVYTGMSRNASKILLDQDTRSKDNEEDIFKLLKQTKKMGQEIKIMLENGDLDSFGRILNDHWEIKKARSKSISNPDMDAIYNLALSNGALGGKLIGAGGGGFFMFYTQNRRRLRQVFNDAGLREMHVAFEFEGTKVVLDQ
jgi:D-glycero-alpha-D-manno-heptose-7-phosphate kinase